MQAPPPPILRAAAATAAPSCAATATAASSGTPMSSAITNSSAMAPSTFLPAPLPSPNTAAAATALFRVNNNGSNGAIATSSAPFRSSNLGSFPPADDRAVMMQSLQNGSSINQQQHMQQQAHQQQLRPQQRRMSLDNQKLQYDDDELDDDLDEDDLDEEDDGDDDMGNNELEAKFSRSMNGGAGFKTESQQQQQQQAASKTSTTGNGNLVQPTIRKRNVGVPKFLRFLYQMLELEDREIIAWSHKGTAFQIRQPDELAERILPKYFKHNKVSSFQRQLNYFGFKKWTKTQTTICTFSHPFFLRGEKDKMKLIKRKERMGPMGVASAASASGGAGSAGCESSDNSSNNNNDTNEGGDSFDASANPDVPTKMPTIPAKPGASLNKRLRANSTVKHKGIGARELAMRRHSTGALALSASLMPPGAVGAAAAALINRKRSGTVDLELELQAQKGMDINKEPALRLPSRAKRKSLPHVMLPPTLKDRKGNQLFSNMDFGGGVGDFRNFSSSMGSATASVGFGAGGGYFGHRMSSESVPTMKQDASAILPVSSEMMLQQVYLRQHSHPGAIGTGNGGVAQFQLSSMKSDNSIDMSDLSGPLQSSTASWGMQPQQSNNGYQPQQQQHAVLHKDPSMMMMHPFKFGEASGASSTFDSMPIMDYATNSAQLSSHTLKTHNQQQPHQQFGNYLHHQQQQQLQQQQQQQQPQQKDYIDVLLESAALEDQLSTQSSEPQASGIPTPWNQHYLQAAHHQQQQQHPSHQAHVSPYGLMQQQQQQQQAHHMNQQQQQHQHHHSLQQQMQLSAMNDLNNSQAHRF